MKRVVCVNNEGASSFLNVGETYDVVTENDKFYSVRVSGFTYPPDMYKYRFVEVQDEPEECEDCHHLCEVEPEDILGFMSEFILTPKRVIYNDRTTIVYWEDDTKTVVKCSKDEKFSEDMGFLAALGKKLYGHRATYLKFIEDAYRQPEFEEKPKKKEKRSNPFKNNKE